MLEIKMAIPKLIHLTWKSRSLPSRWKRIIDAWKRTNPDWKIVFWSDVDNRNYIKTYYPDFLNIYDSYPYPIQRADAIRYFLLKDFGGVYCDMDIEALGSLNSYFQETDGEVYLVQSGNVPVFTNCFMASKPGAKFWDEVIDKLKNPDIPWYAVTKHFHVMFSTGPLMLNRVANATTSVISYLPRNVFMAYSIADDSSVFKEGALLKNHNEGSWNSWDSLFFNFMFKYGINIIIIGTVSAVIIYFLHLNGDLRKLKKLLSSYIK